MGYPGGAGLGPTAGPVGGMRTTGGGGGGGFFICALIACTMAAMFSFWGL
jgi:hypothetical protein